MMYGFKVELMNKDTCGDSDLEKIGTRPCLAISEILYYL